MALTELYAACTAAGYRANSEAGTVDGVTNGIAWRLTLPAGTLDMSVSVSEKNLKKWQETLTAGEVVYHGFGVRLTADGVEHMSGESLLSYIDGWTGYAAAAAGASFDDKFQSYREPIAAYLRGAAGAFLGALVGVLPWILLGLLGWQLWIFGAVISIGSFYGYQWLRGAHATGFAVACIVVSSLIAVLLGEAVSTAVFMVQTAEVALTFWQALATCFTPLGLLSVAGDSLFAILACALGFVGIRGKVMDYTHESGFLRRKK